MHTFAYSVFLLCFSAYLSQNVIISLFFLHFSDTKRSRQIYITFYLLLFLRRVFFLLFACFPRLGDDLICLFSYQMFMLYLFVNT